MDAHITHLDPDDGLVVFIHPASDESVTTMLAADEESGNGRSSWVWLRLPNGDLGLTVFPQGDTYFALEKDAAYPGDWELQWCESCGERPSLVKTQHTSLCTHCAAKEIDQLCSQQP